MDAHGVYPRPGPSALRRAPLHAHAARRVARSLVPVRIAMSVVAHFAGHMPEELDYL